MYKRLMLFTTSILLIAFNTLSQENCTGLKDGKKKKSREKERKIWYLDEK